MFESQSLGAGRYVSYPSRRFWKHRRSKNIPLAEALSAVYPEPDHVASVQSGFCGSGHRQFLPMLPLVCNEAEAIILVFDLTIRSSLQRFGEEQSLSRFSDEPLTYRSLPEAK